MLSFLGRVEVFCFLASYLIVFGLELSRLLLGRSQVSRAVRVFFAVAGFIAHTAYLLARATETNLPPLLSSTRDWMLVLAWLLVLCYLALTLWKPDLAVGVFLLPLVLIVISTGYLVSSDVNPQLAPVAGFRRSLGMIHATFLVLGILGVVVGFVLAMMFLYQQRRLKQHQSLQEGFGLPNLEKLARLNRAAVMVAVPLLTLGFVTGVWLGLEGDERIRFSDPIVIGNGIVWLGMAAVFVRLLTTRKATGKHVASLTLWAGGFLLLTLIGLQILTGTELFNLETWHTTLPVEQDFKFASPAEPAHHQRVSGPHRQTDRTEIPRLSWLAGRGSSFIDLRPQR